MKKYTALCMAVAMLLPSCGSVSEVTKNLGLVVFAAEGVEKILTDGGLNADQFKLLQSWIYDTGVAVATTAEEVASDDPTVLKMTRLADAWTRAILDPKLRLPLDARIAVDSLRAAVDTLLSGINADVKAAASARRPLPNRLPLTAADKRRLKALKKIGEKMADRQ